MSVPSPADQRLLDAFSYGRQAVNEAILEDVEYDPAGPQEGHGHLHGRPVTYVVVDPTFAYWLGWGFPAPASGGGGSSKGEDEVVAIIAIVALVFSSIVAGAIGIYQSVRAAGYKESARFGQEHISAAGRQALASRAQTIVGEDADRRIDRIYANSAKVQSDIGNKKISYAVNSFLICGGCVLITATIALAVFGRPQFGLWALAGPGLAALGAGAAGAIATRVVHWLPPKRQVDEIDEDLRWLVRQHPAVFTEERLSRLQS